MLVYWNKGKKELHDYAQLLMGGRKCLHWELVFPDVLMDGGFDAFVGNPPFIGGKKISGSLGTDYLSYLKSNFQASGATTDLCAYFFRRAFTLLKTSGFMSLLATNTIAEGDTREVGLGHLTKFGSIYRAIRSQPWPGIANLSIAVVSYTKRTWNAEKFLDGLPVETITAMLQCDANLNATPAALQVNLGHCFMGTIVLGEGFILQSKEVENLIEQNTKNSEVIWRYMNGDDLAKRYDQSPSRWVINFGDMTEEQAQEYREPYQLVYERVKPQRDKVKRPAYKERWWQFAEKCSALYKSIFGLNKVLICGNVTKHLSFTFVESENTIFTANVFVFNLQSWEDFACLQSTVHEVFARTFSPTLETRLSYSPRDAFVPYPFPQSTLSVKNAGEKYHVFRNSIMKNRKEGLTSIYNYFHDAENSDPDIVELRQLHVLMDQTVSAAYGWGDIELGHDFYETKRGVRFTICETARRNILDRLLALSHQRHTEELSEKATLPLAAISKRGRKPKETNNQILLNL